MARTTTENYEEGSIEVSEALQQLDNDIEEIGAVPSNEELKDEDSDWSVSLDELQQNFGGKNNALWLIGRKPIREIFVRDNDTELVEHELRGLEHEFGRAPTRTEAVRVNQDIEYEDLSRDAGVPYRTYTMKSHGILDPGREDEAVDRLVRELLVEEKSPERLVRNKKAGETELDLFIDEYLPWVDELYWLGQEPEPDVMEQDNDRLWDIMELLGEGYTQNEVMNELEYSNSSIYEGTKELEKYGLVESKQGSGTWLTQEGRQMLYDGETVKNN